MKLLKNEKILCAGILLSSLLFAFFLLWPNIQDGSMVWPWESDEKVDTPHPDIPWDLPGMPKDPTPKIPGVNAPLPGMPDGPEKVWTGWKDPRGNFEPWSGDPWDDPNRLVVHGPKLPVAKKRTLWDAVTKEEWAANTRVNRGEVLWEVEEHLIPDLTPSLGSAVDGAYNMAKECLNYIKKGDKKAAMTRAICLSNYGGALEGYQTFMTIKNAKVDDKLKKLGKGALKRKHEFEKTSKKHTAKVLSLLKQIKKKVNRGKGTVPAAEVRALKKYLDPLHVEPPARLLRSDGRLPWGSSPRKNTPPFLGAGICPSYQDPSGGGGASPLPKEPGPEDLASTEEATRTQAIQDLAASLDNDPVKIFEYVLNNIDFQLYYGSQKGADSTLLDKAGNDVDQASLLVSLLRAAGIPARYVYGSVSVAESRFSNLIESPDLLSTVFALDTAAIPSSIDKSSAVVTFEHCWVEAHVPYTRYRGSGGDAKGAIWVPLDPSFKNHESSKTTVAMPNNFVPSLEDYYSDSEKRDPLELYKDKVKEHLKQNHPEISLSDLCQKPRIIQQRFDGLLPNKLPFVTDSVIGEYRTLNPTFRKGIRIRFADIDFTLDCWEFFARRLVINFVPADDSDAQLIESYGSLFDTPPQYVEVKPVLLLDGQIIAEGESSAHPGEEIFLHITIIEPNSQEGSTVSHQVTSGATTSINFFSAPVTSNILLEKKKELAHARSSEESNPQFYKNVLFSYLGIQYRVYCLEAGYMMAKFANAGFCVPLQESITGDVLETSYTYDVPTDISRFGTHIDSAINYFNIYSAGQNIPDSLFYYGIHGSLLEGGIFEETLSQDGINSTKSMRLAFENDIQIHTLSKDNISEVDDLDVGEGLKTEIRNMINRGSVVISPHETLTRNAWSGNTFIEKNDFHLSYAFVISTKPLNGGQTTDGPFPDCPWPPYIGKKNGCTDLNRSPVNVISGNFYMPLTCFSIPSNGFPLEFTHTYNSLSDISTAFGLKRSTVFHQTVSSGSIRLADAFGGTKILRDESSSGTYSNDIIVAKGTIDSSGNTMITYNENGTVHAFNEDGKLTTISDRIGNTLTIAHGAQGVMKITDTSGREVVLEYDANGNISKVTRPDGAFFLYTVDETGDLISITNPAGNTRYFTYDDENNLLGFSDFRGNWHSVIYDEGRVLAKVNPLGAYVCYIYDLVNGQTTVFNEKGNMKKYIYNENWQIVKEIDEEGNETLTEWTGFEKIDKFTDALGNTWDFDYDANARLTSIQNPEGNARTYTYAGDYHEIRTVTDSEGNTTTYTCDANGLMTGYNDAQGNSASFTYDESGNLLSHTDERNNTTTYVYDAYGNATRITDPKGHFAEMTYDIMGNMLSSTDKNANTYTFDYTLSGKIEKVHFPGGPRHMFDYDKDGHIVRETNELDYVREYSRDEMGQVVSLTNERGNTQRFTYDQTGLPVLVTDFLGNETRRLFSKRGLLRKKVDSYYYYTEYGYDSTGRLSATYDELGNRLLITYDKNGRPKKTTNKMGYNRELVRDRNGAVVDAIDARGHNTETSLDDLGRIIRSDYSDGSYMEFQYDEVGNTTQISVSGRITAVMEYNERDELVKVANAVGRFMEYTYDNNGELSTFTDLDGQTTTYTYNARGWLVEIENPLGRKKTIIYDDAGFVVSVTNEGGNETRFMYNPLGQVTSIIDARDKSRIIEYDANGNRTEFTDRDGHKTLMRYDHRNRPVLSRSPEGRTNLLGYDPTGRLIWRVNPNGHALHMHRDVLGRVTTVEKPDGATSSMVLDGNNNVLESYDFTGILTTYEWDALNRMTSVTDHKGHVSRFNYDLFGNRTQIDYPDGKSLKYTHDDLDLVTAIEREDGTIMGFTYTEANLLQRMTDARGNYVRFEYNEIKQRTKLVRRTEAGEKEISYSYDPNGNLTGFANYNGFNVSYVYDEIDRLVELHYPLSGMVKKYTYSDEGRVTELEYPDSKKTTYAFNGDGLLTQKNATGSAPVYFGYDGVGRLAWAQNDDSRISREYDSAGRVTTEEIRFFSLGDKVQRIGYAYDANGQLTTMTYPFGSTVEYEREENRITRATYATWGGKSYDIRQSFDARNRLAEREVVGLTRTGYIYDEVDRLLAIESTSKATGRDIASFEYGYDAEGNCLFEKSIFHEEVAANPGTFVKKVLADLFKVDEQDRIVDAKYGLLETETSGTVSDQNKPTVSTTFDAATGYAAREAYEFDSQSNRTRKILDDGQSVIKYNHVDDVYVKDALDRITNINGAVVTHDDNGSMTEAPSFKNAYNGDNRLVSIANADTDEILVEFGYDPLGRLSWTMRRGVKHYILNDLRWRELSVLDSTGAIEQEYLYGERSIDDRIAFTRGTDNATLFFHKDLRGNSRAVTDDTGAVAETHDFDLYGNITASQNGRGESIAWTDTHGVTIHSVIENRIFFSGRAREAETGIYGMRNRFYDPGVGRFSRVDPIDYWGGESLYAYANLNTFVWSDPWGLGPKKEAAFLDALGEYCAGFLTSKDKAGHLFGLTREARALSRWTKINIWRDKVSGGGEDSANKTPVVKILAEPATALISIGKGLGYLVMGVPIEDAKFPSMSSQASQKISLMETEAIRHGAYGPNVRLWGAQQRGRMMTNSVSLGVTETGFITHDYLSGKITHAEMRNLLNEDAKTKAGWAILGATLEVFLRGPNPCRVLKKCNYKLGAPKGGAPRSGSVFTNQQVRALMPGQEKLGHSLAPRHWHTYTPSSQQLQAGIAKVLRSSAGNVHVARGIRLGTETATVYTRQVSIGGAQRWLSVAIYETGASKGTFATALEPTAVQLAGAGLIK